MNLRKAFLAVGAVTTMGAAMAPAALASYGSGYYASGGSGSSNTYANFTASAGYASTAGRQVSVAAHTASYAVYGSWVTGTGNACHNYASNSLGALIYNSESFVQYLSGDFGTGGTHC